MTHTVTAIEGHSLTYTPHTHTPSSVVSYPEVLHGCSCDTEPNACCLFVSISRVNTSMAGDNNTRKVLQVVNDECYINIVCLLLLLTLFWGKYGCTLPRLQSSPFIVPQS